MWGVQSVPMERPAHTALLQSIWNHPAEENSQNVNLGSCGGEGGGSFCGLPLPLLVAAIIRAPANYRVVHLVILYVEFDTSFKNVIFYTLLYVKMKRQDLN